MADNTGEIQLATLPVELVHRIFDHLDVQTILLSVRYVCRRLKTLTDTYDQYKFHLNPIAKSDFSQICRLIQPANIIALSFANNHEQPGGVNLFLSIVQTEQLTRIRSLTLLGIDENMLDRMLNNLNLTLLRYVTIKILKYDDRRQKTTHKLLQKVFSQPHLYSLDIDTSSNRLKTFIWPTNCKIQKLKINGWVDIDYICQILTCCPQLRILILNCSLHNMLFRRSLPTHLSSLFQQLNSLAIESCDVDLKALKPFLQLMPSLIHLKLINRMAIFVLIDGRAWENLIKNHLPKLKTFEFFFVYRLSNPQVQDSMKNIMTRFSSPFWLEDKKWSVCVEFMLLDLRMVRVYSMPICNPIFGYETHPDKMLMYNSTETNQHRSMMNNIETLSIYFHEKFAFNMEPNPTANDQLLFNRVKKLSIKFSRLQNVIEPYKIAALIDLSQITEMEVEFRSEDSYNEARWEKILPLMSLASNLLSVKILFSWDPLNTSISMNYLPAILPPTIKTLEIPTSDLKQIQILIQQCPNLSKIKCRNYNRRERKQIMAWFNEYIPDSTYSVIWGSLCIWFGTRENSQLAKLRRRPKRIKTV